MWIPFTQTDYFQYYFNFFDGLSLDKNYDYSIECTENLAFLIDDFFYFINNVTLETSANGYSSAVNFTQSIAGNFSKTVENCFLFANDFTVTVEEMLVDFEDGFLNFYVGYIVAFLFTQLGNADAYLNIMAELDEAELNNNTAEIYYQYGRLFNKIFDVNPIETGSLQSTNLN